LLEVVAIRRKNAGWESDNEYMFVGKCVKSSDSLIKDN
jgi:hypothetical protein